MHKPARGTDKDEIACLLACHAVSHLLVMWTQRFEIPGRQVRAPARTVPFGFKSVGIKK